MLIVSLLVLFCGVYAFGQLRLFQLDLFFAAAYFYLFVYAIFPLLGYIYVPELSESISAYFGPEIIVPALIFLTLSFLGVYFALYRLCPLKSYSRRLLGGRRVRFNYVFATSLIITGVFAILLLGVALFWSDLSYGNASNTDFIESEGFFYQTWMVALKEAVFVVVVLYSVHRLRYWQREGERLFLIVSTALLASTILVIAYRIGDRADLVALFNGIVFVELIRQEQISGKPIRRALPKLLILVPILLAYASWVEANRSAAEVITQTWYEGALLKDYFPPAHMLFAAIHYDLVDPIEVLKSNAANSLVLLNEPYLQQYVTNAFDSDIVVTRAASYAFFILSEGYLFMGGLGFIYNGIVVAAGLTVWRLLSCTSSSRLNALILPVIAVHLTNFCRGQSSYFLKLIYINYIPALFVIFCATGYHLTVSAYKRPYPFVAP